MNYDATVVITTRNRCQDLVRAVASARAQKGCTVEVLVLDDCSEDDPSERIARDFPEVRLFRSGQRHGYISLRNRGFREALAPVVVSIDDDAYFAAPYTIAEALGFLADHPQCAATALNYLETLPSGRPGNTCLLKHGAQVRSYVGTAHAVRRDVALAMGGYRELFVHQGEERDLCVRMFAAGYTVNHVATPPLVHAVSPQRDPDRVHFYGTRNQLLFDLMYTPASHLLPVLAAHCLKMLRYRFTPHRFTTTIGCICRAIPFLIANRELREPLDWHTLRKWFSLPGHGPTHIPKNQIPPPLTQNMPEYQGLATDQLI